jgi:adenylylsulfate kinase
VEAITQAGQGWTLWLTGLPGAGKTTLARALQQRLRELSIPAVVLDSDAVRPVLAPAAGYDEAARDQVYGQLVGLADLLRREGVNVIIAATAHRRAYRDAARATLAPFAEIWVRCPHAVCETRDPKGLYAEAAAGGLTNLPGTQAPYEPPLAAELIVDTDQETVAHCVSCILEGVSFLTQPRLS